MVADDLRGGAAPPPGPGHALSLNIDPTACTISGDATGNCGDSLVSIGNNGQRAELHFHVEVLDPSAFPPLAWDVTADSASIDLNADVGEGYGPWPMGADEALIPIVTSVNVACGFHAGDPLIIDRTIRLAHRARFDTPCRG
ncbi:hypothetical protein B4Q13_18580 [Lacticaseibacillus rhamnosus]